MAPVSSTVALSHVPGVSDSARERELFKYYQPNAPINAETCFPAIASSGTLQSRSPTAEEDRTDLNVNSDITSSKISSPDTALTSFCQLVSWRTGAQRAMISLIDASTQYFIAESTKTVDLLDNTKHAPGDSIWMGCGSVSKAGKLCERTIQVEPTKEGEYPSFIVNDLTKDERFDELPFVTGSPFLRFYAGVPLITKRGIPIGSLFIVDDRVWDGLSKDMIHFMGTMAGTIMKHLEMAREVEEHRRGMKMSRGLASFVEGRSQLVEAEADADDGEGTKIAGQFETDVGIGRTRSKAGSRKGSLRSTVGSVSSIERREREYSAALYKTEEAIISAQDTADAQSPRPPFDSGSQPNSFGGTSMSVLSPPVDDSTENPISPGESLSEVSSIKVLFSRAANLIREAFEVDGGAVFYDAQRGFGDLQKPGSPTSPQHEDNQEVTGDDLASSGELPSDPDDKSLGSRDSPSVAGETFSRSTVESKKFVEVLGFSTAHASSIHGDEYPGPHSFVPFPEKALHTLLSKYPRGKLWTFDSDGSVSSSSEEEVFEIFKKDPAQHAMDVQKRKKRSARARSDAKFLLRHFPGVRQLLFVPLWDAGRSRWLSGCCAWSTEPTRILSKQSELAFLSAFGNSVMAECSRIDTEIADQKKGDFIGSISHELRSPLHGILASAEFLGEESLTGFEKGLVETIDSCGRTLLDTINHILDFSKINHFEKNWRKNKRGGSRPTPRTTNSALALRQSDIPMINLFADVDISIVCEEVVESVFAGHVFQNVTAQSFDMVPHSKGKMSDPRGFLTEGTMTADHVKHPEVAVILDIDIQNYHFTTQPGAFRRVIMNLLGNALKYTSHGYVRVRLDATEIDDLHTPGSGDSVARSMVTLTVTDTGKGISSEFLRSKLFTPFAQENSLSSGTGLGLSIVRSIVALLEGEITIDSELGRGTQVKVTLPLLREMPKLSESSGSTPRSTSSFEKDQTVTLLRARALGMKVSLFGFELASPDPILNTMAKLLKKSVTNFLTNWYGLKVVPLGQKANIIIANEADSTTISKLTQIGSTNRRSPTILVLCSHSSRFDRTLSGKAAHSNVGFVAKPVGPLKLARALGACLEGAPPLSTPSLLDPSSASSQTGSSDLSNVFEELSLSPNGGEVLDNSRMAADSDNARKAIESPTPNASVEKHQEFPFPTDDRPLPLKHHSMPSDKVSLAPLTGGHETSSVATVLADMERTSDSSASKSNITVTSPSPAIPSSPPISSLKSPHLLLVDDNKINLSLLRTYMRKSNTPS